MTAPQRMPVRILLTGLMATGKSTIGRVLAQRLGRPYLDNDSRLQEATGHPLAEFAGGDIEVLHGEEAALFAELLGTPGPWVASAAASVVLNAASVDALRASDVCTVWLRARAQTLARRVAHDSARPLLAQHPLEVLQSMARERDPLFAAIAGVTVDVDSGDVAAIVDTILERLGV